MHIVGQLHFVQNMDYPNCMDGNLLFWQEWRHAHGMRCLGIPNTAHFANVTLIEDAIACKWPASPGLWHSYLMVQGQSCALLTCQ